MGDTDLFHLQGPLFPSLGDGVSECHGLFWFEWNFLEGILPADTPPSRSLFWD